MAIESIVWTSLVSSTLARLDVVFSCFQSGRLSSKLLAFLIKRALHRLHLQTFSNIYLVMTKVVIFSQFNPKRSSSFKWFVTQTSNVESEVDSRTWCSFPLRNLRRSVMIAQAMKYNVSASVCCCWSPEKNSLYWGCLLFWFLNCSRFRGWRQEVSLCVSSPSRTRTARCTRAHAYVLCCECMCTLTSCSVVVVRCAPARVHVWHVVINARACTSILCPFF